MANLSSPKRRAPIKPDNLSNYEIRSLSLAERIKRLSRPDLATGCIHFLGSLNNMGYGIISFGGRTRLAHRQAWIVEKGPIEDGLLILHQCDTPDCINVAHMKLGTQADNLREMMERKRGYSGTRNHLCKLTEEQVLAIRADRRPHRTIGKAYGISKTNVGDIIRGRIWRHL